MTQVNIGTTANDGTGSALRNAFQIINSNFSEVTQSLLDLSTELSNLNPASETYVDDAIAAVNLTIDGIELQISDMNDSITDLESAVSVLQTNIITKASTASLNAAVASLNQAISAINNSLADLTDRVEALEN